MTQPTHSRRKMLIASVSAGLCALVHAESSKAAEVVRIIVGFPPRAGNGHRGQVACRKIANNHR